MEGLLRRLLCKEIGKDGVSQAYCDMYESGLGKKAKDDCPVCFQRGDPGTSTLQCSPGNHDKIGT